MPNTTTTTTNDNKLGDYESIYIYIKVWLNYKKIFNLLLSNNYEGIDMIQTTLSNDIWHRQGSCHRPVYVGFDTGIGH